MLNGYFDPREIHLLLANTHLAYTKGVNFYKKKAGPMMEQTQNSGRTWRLCDGPGASWKCEGGGEMYL